MAELGDRLRFALEASTVVGIAGQVPRQFLDRHFVTETNVLGEIDFTHPTLAQATADTVVGDDLADHGRSGEPRTTPG